MSSIQKVVFCIALFRLQNSKKVFEGLQISFYNEERGMRILSMLNKERFVEKNSMMVREFDRYILEHPEFSERIPNNALIVMQIEGDEEFNQWAKETALKVAEKDQPIVYVTITELKPVRSRIEKLRLESVA